MEWGLSHNPFRSWCRQCVAGRGLERRHLGRKGGELDEQPYISIDYGYLAGDATPMLVVKDRLSGMVFAMAVERKGVARVRETLLHCCHNTLVTFTFRNVVFGKNSSLQFVL